MRHQGSSIIVTGAAGAIGFATCEILAREGARLLMVDIDESRLQERAAQLAGAGHEVIAHRADCAEEAAVAGYARAAIDAFGRIVSSGTVDIDGMIFLLVVGILRGKSVELVAEGDA